MIIIYSTYTTIHHEWFTIRPIILFTINSHYIIQHIYSYSPLNPSSTMSLSIPLAVNPSSLTHRSTAQRSSATPKAVALCAGRCARGSPQRGEPAVEALVLGFSVGFKWSENNEALMMVWWWLMMIVLMVISLRMLICSDDFNLTVDDD